MQKPPTFSGQGPKKYDDYEVWSDKLKSYMTTIDDQLSLLMGEAEKSEDPIYVLENNIPIDYTYYIEN